MHRDQRKLDHCTLIPMTDQHQPDSHYNSSCTLRKHGTNSGGQPPPADRYTELVPEGSRHNFLDRTCLLSHSFSLDLW